LITLAVREGLIHFQMVADEYRLLARILAQTSPNLIMGSAINK